MTGAVLNWTLNLAGETLLCFINLLILIHYSLVKFKLNTHLIQLGYKCTGCLLITS